MVDLDGDGTLEAHEIARQVAERAYWRTQAFMASLAGESIIGTALRFTLFVLPWPFYDAIFSVCWDCYDFEVPETEPTAHGIDPQCAQCTVPPAVTDRCTVHALHGCAGGDDARDRPPAWPRPPRLARRGGARHGLRHRRQQLVQCAAPRRRPHERELVPLPLGAGDAGPAASTLLPCPTFCTHPCRSPRAHR